MLEPEVTSPFKAIIDTNVWISGIFFRRGLPARLLRAWRDDLYRIVVTREILAELAAQLQRKSAQFAAPPELADEWLRYIRTYAHLVPANNTVVGVCRDPKDDQFLDAAISGDAPFLVTGDKDLLSLGRYETVQIVSPREFATLLNLPGTTEGKSK